MRPESGCVDLIAEVANRQILVAVAGEDLGLNIAVLHHARAEAVADEDDGFVGLVDERGRRKDSGEQGEAGRESFHGGTEHYW